MKIAVYLMPSLKMIKTTGIDSLTYFRKIAKTFAGRLGGRMEPFVLTINEKANLVAQEPKAYQAMFYELGRRRFVEAVRGGFKEPC